MALKYNGTNITVSGSIKFQNNNIELVSKNGQEVFNPILPLDPSKYYRFPDTNWHTNATVTSNVSNNRNFKGFHFNGKIGYCTTCRWICAFDLSDKANGSSANYAATGYGGNFIAFSFPFPITPLKIQVSSGYRGHGFNSGTFQFYKNYTWDDENNTLSFDANDLINSLVVGSGTVSPYKFTRSFSDVEKTKAIRLTVTWKLYNQAYANSGSDAYYEIAEIYTWFKVRQRDLLKYEKMYYPNGLTLNEYS